MRTVTHIPILLALLVVVVLKIGCLDVAGEPDSHPTAEPAADGTVEPAAGGTVEPAVKLTGQAAAEGRLTDFLASCPATLSGHGGDLHRCGGDVRTQTFGLCGGEGEEPCPLTRVIGGDILGYQAQDTQIFGGVDRPVPLEGIRLVEGPYACVFAIEYGEGGAPETILGSCKAPFRADDPVFEAKADDPSALAAYLLFRNHEEHGGDGHPEFAPEEVVRFIEAVAAHGYDEWFAARRGIDVAATLANLAGGRAVVAWRSPLDVTLNVLECDGETPLVGRYNCKADYVVRSVVPAEEGQCILPWWPLDADPGEYHTAQASTFCTARHPADILWQEDLEELDCVLHNGIHREEVEAQADCAFRHRLGAAHELAYPLDPRGEGSYSVLLNSEPGLIHATGWAEVGIAGPGQLRLDIVGGDGIVVVGLVYRLTEGEPGEPGDGELVAALQPDGRTSFVWESEGGVHVFRILVATAHTTLRGPETRCGAYSITASIAYDL